MDDASPAAQEHKWVEQVLHADDFLPEQDWHVLASVGYMCDDPYTGTRGQVTDNIYGIYRVTTRLATRKASSLITFTVRLMESLETTRQLFSPRLVRFLSGVDHTTRPVKISDSHMFRRAAWLVPLVLVSACAPARRMPTRVPTSAEIHVVIIQSPAINAVTRLGDRTGECPALTIGVTEGMFRQLSLDMLRAALAHELGHME